MATLVILLPARLRGDASASAAPEYAYAMSNDGQSVVAQGRAAPALLPKADTVVAVLPDRDISWHQLDLPRAPAARLRPAIAGVLEEQLLDDAEALHLAVAPGGSGGQNGWVAALHRGQLQAHLQALEQAGVLVERVVPISWPDEAALGHFLADSETADGSAAQTWLVLSDAAGVQSINLAGALARSLLTTWAARGTRFSSSPAVSAQAERWLGAPVLVMTDAERALAATRTLWNLRQFELALRHRGTRALRDAWKRFLSPAWRPLRLGLASLLLVQAVGLNLWAWHQTREIAQRRDATTALLKTTFPQVRAVIDAPAQMRAETEALRVRAGQAGPDDFESLLDALSRVWPAGLPPLDSVRYEGRRLIVGVRGLAEPQQAEIARLLAAGGWRLEPQEGRLVVSVASPGAKP
ncbi:MAG: type II secretion system protein GspL [Aquabacterium sp.]